MTLAELVTTYVNHLDHHLQVPLRQAGEPRACRSSRGTIDYPT